VHDRPPALFQVHIVANTKVAEFAKFSCDYARSLAKTSKNAPFIPGSLKPVKVAASGCGLKKLWCNQLKQIEAVPYLRKHLKNKGYEKLSPRTLRDSLPEGQQQGVMGDLFLRTNGEVIPTS
jgi:hypothetical protein